ncbi:MAG: alpha/beta fold hydrolase, partial [Burkholderiaceae bacterium]
VATMHPQQVRTVAVYEPVLFRWLMDDVERCGSLQEVTEIAESIRESIKARAEHEAAKRFVDFWSGAGAWDLMSPRGRETSVKRIHAVMRHFDALYKEPVEHARLASLKMPTLYLSGAETVAVARRVAEVFHRAVPHCRQEVLPAMGHIGPITHANEVNQRLLTFLQAQDCSVDMRAAA